MVFLSRQLKAHIIDQVPVGYVDPARNQRMVHGQAAAARGKIAEVVGACTQECARHNSVQKNYVTLGYRRENRADSG